MAIKQNLKSRKKGQQCAIPHTTLIMKVLKANVYVVGKGSGTKELPYKGAILPIDNSEFLICNFRISILAGLLYNIMRIFLIRLIEH